MDLDLNQQQKVLGAFAGSDSMIIFVTVGILICRKLKLDRICAMAMFYLGYLIGQGAAGNLVVEGAWLDSRFNGTYVPYNSRTDVWNGGAEAYDGTRSGQWFYNATSDVYLVPEYN